MGYKILMNVGFTNGGATLLQETSKDACRKPRRLRLQEVYGGIFALPQGEYTKHSGLISWAVHHPKPLWHLLRQSCLAAGNRTQRHTGEIARLLGPQLMAAPKRSRQMCHQGLHHLLLVK